MHTASTQHGYVLLYTMLAIMVFLSLGTGLVVSTVREAEIGALELESTKALAASDVGMECVAYWQKQSGLRPFSSNVDGGTIRCDVDPGTQVFINTYYDNSATVCTPYVYPEITIGPLANGSCAKVNISVQPFLPVAPGDQVCKVKMESHGLNDCNAPTVERVRWREL